MVSQVSCYNAEYEFPENMFIKYFIERDVHCIVKNETLLWTKFEYPTRVIQAAWRRFRRRFPKCPGAPVKPFGPRRVHTVAQPVFI